MVRYGASVAQRQPRRQVPSPRFLGHPEPSGAVESAVGKNARRSARITASPGYERLAPPLRARSQRTGRVAFLLKQLRCPVCGAAETLNCHSKLYGNDPQKADGCVQRGQRVWCCNRGQRGGCGRSFSIFLADILPRHTVRAATVWALVSGLLAGRSIAAAARALPHAPETLYHLLHRLRARLTTLRSGLSAERPAPASSQSDPLLQTVEHLRNLFPQSESPTAEFQLHFQRSLLV
jgi:hypothetical protein